MLTTDIFRLGLTGGMGSGKSTVAAILTTLGAKLIDADAISRASTAVGGSANALIRSQFGPSLIKDDGSLDRDRMRTLIFTDAKAKSRLENIIHPIVAEDIALQTKHFEQNGATCVVYDIPLLAETGHWRAKLNRVLVVDCSVQTQLDRISKRNGLRATDSQRILSSQASRQLRVTVADMVLFNDDITIVELEHQLRLIAPQFGL